MNVEIRRGNGIEGLVGRYIPREVEEETKIDTVKNEELEGLMKQHEEMLDTYDWEKSDIFTGKFTTVLTPEQINAFLQTTIRHETHENYLRYTGHFISRLIQNSYEAGHNNFTLNTTGLTEFHNIGYPLEGTEETPIHITIQGNLGQYCGWESRNCTYNIKGNTGNNCGYDSEKCTFNINENTGNDCGWESRNCTYKTPNKETLEKMLKNVPKGNRIIFIHPNGKEEVMRTHDKH